MSRPVRVLGAVVATLVVALGAADATAGRPTPPPSTITAGSVTTVRQATVVCPDARGGVDHQVTWVRAAGAGQGIVAGAPTITATTVTSKASDFAPASADLGLIPYGDAFGGRIDKGNRALAITATGPSAVGFGATQVTRATTGLSRGIAATSCAAPSTEFTFVGGSTAVGNQLKLVLTNVDDATASVDIALIGKDGPVNTQGAQGVQVPPHTRRSIDLVKLGPNETELTTMVSAVTGRVAAAELTSRLTGTVARGLEWIPDAGPASRRSLVPGMMAEPGKRTLVIADPGATAANVAVQVVSDSGTFTPNNLEDVQVPAGGLTSIDVTGPLAGHPGALLITSDQPVVAGASQELTSTTSQITDVTWSAQTPNLNGTAVIPTIPINGSAVRDVWIYLTAVHGDGSVTITPNGPLDTSQTTYPPSVTVKVAGGTTVVADLGGLLGSQGGNLTAKVTNDPNGGPVTGSVLFREQAPDGLMAGQVGLVSVPGIIVLPSVREDPTVSGARPGEIQPSTAP
ncbi:hypothetical protein acdb102_29670 [Acidothermaceae bacterium B102]|nr:hypothetical protein acdb102_29670 [Acidothermaceae bacterium B102]